MKSTYLTVRQTLITTAVIVGLISFFFSLPTPAEPDKEASKTGADLAEPAGEALLAFRDIRIFDGERTYRGNVVVEGERIAAIGPTAEIPVGARIVDGAGKTLLPGLIDAHTHSWGDALERAVVFGVTTHLDMFTDATFAAQMRAEQASGEAHDRADLYSASTLVTAAGGHGTQFGMPIPTLDDAAQAEAFIDARIAEGADFIKLVYEPAGGHMPTLSKAALHAGIAAAKERDKLAVVHVSSLDGARLALDGGADGLVHIFRYGEPPADFGGTVKKQGAFVIPTLAISASVAGQASTVALDDDSPLKPFLNPAERRNLALDFGGRKPAPESYALAKRATAMLHQAGVPILAGTDAPNPGTTYGASMQDELILLVDAGLTPLEALTAATATPAALFGLEDRGRLAVGRRADLLLVEGDPTADIRAAQAIVGVWKAGREIPRQPVPDLPAGPAVERLISAFGEADLSSDFGSDWFVSDDSIRNGTSTAELTAVARGTDGDWAMHVQGAVTDGFAFPWAGAMIFTGEQPMQPVDLSAHRSISFDIRGNHSSFNFMVFSGTAPIPASRSIEITEDWQRIELSFEDLAVDPSSLKGFLFSGGPAEGPFELWIDNVRLQ